jgi:hypothetical protein
MRKIAFLVLIAVFAAAGHAQKCDKGCGKITKVEPTKNPKIRQDRALLNFKFVGPDGGPVKSKVKIIIDSDTIVPVLDKFGGTKMTAAGGPHKIRFKVNWWYTVKMDQVSLKVKNTYHFLVKFEAKEIGGSKPTDDD